jgi:hypothetical protein
MGPPKVYLIVLLLVELNIVSHAYDGEDKGVKKEPEAEAGPPKKESKILEKLSTLILGKLVKIGQKSRKLPLFGDIRPFDEVEIPEEMTPWFLDPKKKFKVSVRFNGQKYVTQWKDEKKSWTE